MRWCTSVRAVQLLYPRGPRSGPGYVVPVHRHLTGPIRPTRRHSSTSPPCGLYALSSLCVISGDIWERLHYDWSNSNHVVLTTTDSNVWGGASGHTYNFTRHTDGTTDVDLVVVREGKNLKGRLLGFVLRTIGRSVLEKAFVNSVAAIEARNVSDYHPSRREKMYV